MADELNQAREAARGARPQGPTPALVEEARKFAIPSAGPPGRGEQFGQRELGAPGLSDWGARFDVAAASTLDEKVTAFKAHYPEGDLQKDIVDKTLYFRPDLSTPWAKVTSGLLEKHGALGGLIDFVAADLGATAGEVALTARTRGMHLVPLVLRSILGTTTGEVAQQGVQELRGLNTQGLGEIVQEGVEKGIMGGAGAGMGKFIGKGIEGIRGGGFLETRPGATGARISAERLGVPEPIPHQMSDSPIIRRMVGQASAVLPTVGRYLERQDQAVRVALRRGTNPGSIKLLQTDLRKIHDEAKSDILNVVRVKNLEAPETGILLQSGIQEYDTVAKRVVDDAYAYARGLETPKFDLTEAKAAADVLELGVPFAKEPVEKTVLKPRQALSSVKTPLGPIETKTMEEGVGNAQAPLLSELKRVIQSIKEMDPSQPIVVVNGVEHSQTEALKKLRSRLWELKTPEPDQLFREEHALAADMYHAISRTLDNPINSDGVFRQAWRSAAGLARDRFDTWDKLIIIKVAKSETPGQLATRITQPGQSENLKILRGILPNDKFFDMQQFAKAELLRNPDALSQNLAKYDKPTLDMIMPKEEQVLFREVAGKIDALNRIDLPGILRKQSQYGRLVDEAVARNDTAQIAALAELVKKSGGHESSLGKMIRAGILDNIYKRSVAVPSGELTPRVMLSALQSEIAKLRESGATRFLTQADLRRLLDVEIVKSLVTLGRDTGTSIAGSETVSGLRGLSRRAFHTLLEHMGTGRMLTNPNVTNFLVTRGKAKSSHEVLKATSASLGVMLHETGDRN